MGLTKALLGFLAEDASSGTIALTGLDTSAYSHILLFVKHEGAPTTIDAADNKGSGAYAPLTKIDHSNGDMSARMEWVKLGTPGTGTTVTVTFGAARTFRRLGVWGIKADSGDIAVYQEAANKSPASSTTPDAGILSTVIPTVSFMGVGEYFTETYTPGGGWNEDWDNTSSFGASRSDLTGDLDPACTAANSMDWACCAVSFKEVKPPAMNYATFPVSPLAKQFSLGRAA